LVRISAHMLSVVSGTVLQVYVPSLKVMLNEEVVAFDVCGTFGAGCSAILFKRESDHVVLEDHIGKD
jgi:hypothetical protein